jgi:hypothetical protein
MDADEIGRVLDEIGERIGPAGEYAWTLSVRQVWVEGFVFLLASVLLSMASVALIAAARNHNAKVRERRSANGYYNGSETDGVEWLGVVFIEVFALALLVVASLNLLNPEYHAMMRLLERIVP